MNRLDYISILTGGNCAFDCPFCIGQSIRKDEPPHFGKGYLNFIEEMGNYTNELSISGSNSDPIFIDEKILNDIFAIAKENNLFLSFHTLSKSKKTERLTEKVDEMCMSTHDDNNKNIKFVNDLAKNHKNKLRLSSVCTQNNKEMFEDIDFYMAYDVDKFTIRLDVFDDNLKTPVLPIEPTNKTDFGATWYEFYGKKIAIWDFKEVNKQINALYLWPDGEIREQCHWNEMHNKPPKHYE